jgi:hypothetical protein
MEELLQKLQEKAGVTKEQAENSLHAVKEYIIEKFPMLEGAVTNMFGPSAPVAPVGSPAVVEEPGVMDKISDATQKASDKIGDFANTAADKAEELYDSAKDKLTGFFGGKKD